MKELASLCLSPTSLGVFDLCPRLFRYRYLESEYFSIPTDPALEQSARRGIEFHRLVELLSPLPDRERQVWLDRIEPPVSHWWQAFSRSGLDRPEGRVFSELPIWITFGGWRLLIRIDRLVITPHGQWQIWDWKTGKRPSVDKIKPSWQLRLYPLVLCLGARVLNQGSSILPDGISIHFWYAQDPDRPHLFTYSSSQLESDKQHLQQALSQIEQKAAEQFPKINVASICTPCFFRQQCWGRHPIGSDEYQLELFTEQNFLEQFTGDEFTDRER